jgi:hypothetical protein
MGAMFCSYCHGENVTKLSLVYETGLSYTSLDSAGLGFGLPGGIGVGSGHTWGTSATALVDRAAPPTQEHFAVPFILMAVFGAIGLIPGLYGLLILAGIFGLIVYRAALLSG